MRISGLLIWLMIASGLLGQSDKIFESGNAAFGEGNYVSAISEYSKLLDQGYSSPELLYNVGTSYLHLDQLGKAVLYLEKAHLAEPSDKLINQNLVLARDRVDTAVIEVPDFVLFRAWKSLSGFLSPLIWFILSLLAGVVIVLGVCKWRLGTDNKLRVKGFSLMIIGAVILIIFHLAGRSSYAQLKDNSMAIVVRDTALYEAADERSEEFEALSEGVKVKIFDELDEWYRVSLVNKEIGWVTKQSVQRVNETEFAE